MFHNIDYLIIALAVSCSSNQQYLSIPLLHCPLQYLSQNTIATISDFVLSLRVIWLMGKELFTDDSEVLTSALISALIIAAGERFFHKYIDR